MQPQTRQSLVTMHVVLAGFFLPMALIFAITGGLYTFAIRGGYETTKSEILLSLPEEPGLTELQATAEDYFKQQGLSAPTGGANIRKVGTSWQFEWTGSDYDFTLEPTLTPGSYKISVKKTDWHRHFVQLHKAKGGLPFKILAAAFAVGLLLLFATGVLMSLSSRLMKKKMLISLLAGVVTCAVLAALS